MRSKMSDNAARIGLWVHVLCYVVGIAAQVVLWRLLTPDHFFWPLWSFLGWTIGLAFHFWAVRSAQTMRSRY
ncbi:2TM domain-containing protein [Asanoa ishikariensis]|uniref:2TM domain-containing protein n=1 Tax=Asanoa ishikariensis TaxID=137265 RepID=A0A1H3UIZ1_9ACTN|nr:2TM domain-containing protein [Asanoa ishikariensis]SDZ62443.1 2TM domain-containing protein [Asanoa ishikariensis]